MPNQTGLTEAALRAIVGDVAGANAAQLLALDQPFDEAGLDSLDHAQVLIRLDEDHGITVADEDFERCNTIQAILDYVGR